MADPQINVIGPKGGLHFPHVNPTVIIVATIILAIVAVVTGLLLFGARQNQFVASPGQAASTPGWSIAQNCGGFSVTAPEHPAFVAIADFTPDPVVHGTWANAQTFNQSAGAGGTFTYSYTGTPPPGWVRIRAQVGGVSRVDIEQPLTPCSTPTPGPSTPPAACTVSFTISPTPTPGVTPSPTPTPITYPTPTPTPTPVPGVTPSPTPTPITYPTPTPTTITYAPTPTPVTLEQAGTATGTWVISIAGAALLILGSSLFFLL